MTVDSRAKGARTENTVKELLKKHTGLKWERVPGSGALDPKHGLKADLYIPGTTNIYAVEVKGYEADHLTSQVLTSKTPQLLEFWKQAVRQAAQVGKKPLLCFKYDRSKVFVAFGDFPSTDKYRWFFINAEGFEFYAAVLEDWLVHENPKFIA